MDAISEADLFLNFGRDAQAEDVLKEALRANPNNVPVQLKLLGIYANRKDLNAFTSIARQIKDSGDAAAWEQTAALGRTVDPSNPMYGGTGGAAAAAAAAATAAALVESGRPGAVPLDMDIGFGIPMDLDVTAAAPALDVSAPGMDFDVSAYVAGSTPAMDLDVTSEHVPVAEPLLPDFDVTGGHAAAAAPAMDFDVTGSHPNVTAAPGMDFDITGGGQPGIADTQLMDFDVTGSHPNVTAAAPAPGMSTMVLESPLAFEVPAAAPAEAEAFPALGGMDFDLGGAPEAPAAAPAAFDMDFVSAAPAAEPGAPPAPEAPAGLGGLDFDISAGLRAEAPAAPAPEAPSGLGGLDFDISSGLRAAAPAAPAPEAPSGLGGLDFDISSGLRAEAPAAAVPEAPSELGGMDFDLSASSSMVVPTAGGELAGLGAMDFDVSVPHLAPAESPEPTMDLSGISLNLGEADTVVLQAKEAKAEARAPEAADEVANKLELAIAFQTMGDADTARELLGEVLKEGNAEQIEAARAAMQQL